MSKNHNLNGIAQQVELGKRGPKIQGASSSIIEARNNLDTDYAIIRGDHPVNENDLVTKKYLETRADVRVIGQIDGTAPPAPAALGVIYICTTSGGIYTEDYLYRSTGSSWEEIIPSDGMTIVITIDLTGGNVEYTGDHLYLWDEPTTTWKDLGRAPNLTAVVATVAFPFSYVNSGVNPIITLPENVIVSRVQLNVEVSWNDVLPGVQIGDSIDPDRFMEEKHSDLNIVDLYYVMTHHLYGSSTEILLTLNNNGATPVQGQATASIHYDIL